MSWLHNASDDGTATAVMTRGEDGTDESLAGTSVPEMASLTTRVITFLAIVLPFVGLVAAIVLLWGTGIGWVHLVLFVGGYLVTGLGITIGFHRLFTHKSFDTNPVVKATLGILGSMAVQGPILGWVANHRAHHQHSDRHDDPHSPHRHGEGLGALVKGFYHSHIGWLFEEPGENMARYVPDLKADPVVRWVSNLFPLWAILGLIIPTAIAWWWTGSWVGGLLGLLWGGAARVFLVHHITWSINSACHLWGTQPFRSHDHSRNNPVFGILAFGEGWHNNHHAFPASARHGLAWWQFDSSYLIIKAMEMVGLAKNVRLPAPERVEARRRKPE